MYRLISTAVKIAIASLLTGIILSRLDISAEQVLSELGLTPEFVLNSLQHGIAWAIPNIVIGSMVIVPIWLVVYLFRPPRG